ncbi:uncharacterized protein LOC132204102 [Neocloeon triangulifer]|uniref:uncharacterized protein LOC132204102 n=1 Tax=Neocloeon triangulifer TaxID=2078957 RepID=UPI00286EFF5D|nr:uncharacterized protein LOC132204102 [Neocloeon triangulifer]XP_059488348.1 uncharacterized protein LOC132204102 [Neocloeon triangulifer]
MKENKAGKQRFKVHLDPDEVMTQLQQMGYKNLSPSQLQIFMKDLTKLIKHDLKKNLNSSESSAEGFACSASSSTGETNMSTNQSTFASSFSTRDPLKDIDGNLRTGSFNSASSSTSLSKGSSRDEKLSEMPKRRIPKDCKKLKEPPRHDPVALYHYYEKFWKQFNIPKENNPAIWQNQQISRKSAGDRLCF